MDDRDHEELSTGPTLAQQPTSGSSIGPNRHFAHICSNNQSLKKQPATMRHHISTMLYSVHYHVLYSLWGSSGQERRYALLLAEDMASAAHATTRHHICTLLYYIHFHVIYYLWGASGQGRRHPVLPALARRMKPLPGTLAHPSGLKRKARR